MKSKTRIAIGVVLGIVALFLIRGFGGGEQGTGLSNSETAKEQTQANPQDLSLIPGADLVDPQAAGSEQMRAGIADPSNAQRDADTSNLALTEGQTESASDAPLSGADNGVGLLSGKVVLSDGTPLPGVMVLATLIRKLTGPSKAKPATPQSGEVEGLFYSMRTDKAGAFEFQSVPPGIYGITVPNDPDLPVRGSNEFNTHDSPLRIEVDALLLHLTNLDASNKMVPMASYSYEVLPIGDPQEPDSWIGRSETSSWLGTEPGQSVLLLTTEQAEFTATDELDKEYFGTLVPGLPSGLHQFFLREDSED